MKFKLSRSGYRVEPDRLDLYKQLGFEITAKDCWGEPSPCTDSDTTIEIASLDDLLDLIDKVGDVIVNKEEIEIYDDYRE